MGYLGLESCLFLGGEIQSVECIVLYVVRSSKFDAERTVSIFFVSGSELWESCAYF